MEINDEVIKVEYDERFKIDLIVWKSVDWIVEYTDTEVLK